MSISQKYAVMWHNLTAPDRDEISLVLSCVIFSRPQSNNWRLHGWLSAILFCLQLIAARRFYLDLSTL